MPSLPITLDASRAKAGAREFDRATRDVSQSAARAATSINKTNTATQKLSRTFRALVGLGAGAAFVGFTRRLAEATDRTGKFAQRIGISVEALSALEHAARLAGLGTSELDNSMQRFLRRIGDMRTSGTGEALKAFETLGLVSEAMTENDTGALMERVADAFRQIGDQTTRLSVLQRLFGREGVGMSVLLQGGSAGLRRALQDAKDSGAIITQEQAQIAADFNDNLERLQANAMSLARDSGAMALLGASFDGLASSINGARSALSEYRTATAVRQARSIDDLGGAANTDPKRLAAVVNDILNLEAAQDAGRQHPSIDEGLIRLRRFEAQLRSQIQNRKRDAALGVGGARRDFMPGSSTDPTAAGRLARRGGTPADINAVLAQQDAADKSLLDSAMKSQAMFPTPKPGATDEVKSYWDAFITGATDAHQLGIRAADQFSNSLATSLLDVAESAKNAGEIMRNFAQSTAREIARLALQILILRAVAGIAGAFSAAGGAAGAPAAAEASGNAIGSSATIGPIQAGGFAEGGIATGPSSGYLALLHGTELVTPLNGQSGAAGVGGITIIQNFEIQAFDSQSIDRTVLESIGREARTVTAVITQTQARSPNMRGAA